MDQQEIQQQLDAIMPEVNALMERNLTYTDHQKAEDEKLQIAAATMDNPNFQYSHHERMGGFYIPQKIPDQEKIDKIIDEKLEFNINQLNPEQKQEEGSLFLHALTLSKELLFDYTSELNSINKVAGPTTKQSLYSAFSRQKNTYQLNRGRIPDLKNKISQLSSLSQKIANQLKFYPVSSGGKRKSKKSRRTRKTRTTRKSRKSRKSKRRYKK
jgi:hypothetical protein